MSWTPGPWHAKPVTEAAPVWVVEGPEIADWTPNALRWDGYTETDARLIAAAPEMAELLKLIAAAAWPTDEVATPEEVEMWRGIEPRLRALLSRIRGEAEVTT